jgi:hypothetical protein
LIDLKVIFLDVDGVLNNDATTTHTKGGAEFVDDYLIERLKGLIDATGATVIMSSSWRYGLTCERHHDDFVELIEKLESHGVCVSGYTPTMNTAHKSVEIKQYLLDHPEVDRFVILDDDEIELYPDQHVETLNRYGLTDENVDEAIEILNKN